MLNLLNFSWTKEIINSFAADKIENDTSYDIAIGWDLRHLLGIKTIYSKERLAYDNISIPIETTLKVYKAFKKARAGNSKELEHLEKICRMYEEILGMILEVENRATEILDTNCKKVNIRNIASEY